MVVEGQEKPVCPVYGRHACMGTVEQRLIRTIAIIAIFVRAASIPVTRTSAQTKETSKTRLSQNIIQILKKFEHL